ncbi:MAG: transposase [Ostreibacterium sp.]
MLVTDEVESTPASKDKDTKWTKKGGRFYLGYKLHAGSDEAGFIEKVQVTPANVHESRHFDSLLDEDGKDKVLLSDKGYASKANRVFIESKGYGDGIMHKGSAKDKSNRTTNQTASLRD